MKQILISINNKIFDITLYISKHPGEGIRSIYLKQYNRRESTEEYDRFHMTDEPDEILNYAIKNDIENKKGIDYICPFFFKRRIPKYFINVKDDIYGIKYMGDKENNTFILRKSNSDINNSLSVTYKDNGGNIKQLKITKVNNGWYTLWEDEEGNPSDITHKYVEDIIKNVFEQNGYIGII
jgi:hypothetical protein